MKIFRKTANKDFNLDQLSIMIYLGNKPSNLNELINYIVNEIQHSKLSSLFVPFSVEEIHSTLIGLEQIRDSNSDKFLNANIFHEFGIKKEMNFDKLIEIIESFLPITVRFGGLDRSFDKFKSWEDIPYIRTFQLLCPAGDFTLVGWPHKDGTYDKTLWSLRETIEKECSIRHKYARIKDNDFFMRIGTLKNNTCQLLVENDELRSEVDKAEENIRQYLYINPLDIKITPKDVYLVYYTQEISSIKVINSYPISDNKLNSEFIKKCLIKHCT
jgi:hypothetical protein